MSVRRKHKLDAAAYRAVKALEQRASKWDSINRILPKPRTRKPGSRSGAAGISIFRAASREYRAAGKPRGQWRRYVEAATNAYHANR